MSLADSIFPMKRRRLAAYEGVASTIENAVGERGQSLEWGDFTSLRLEDGYLESIRKRCVAICEEHPVADTGRPCSPEGVDALRVVARELRRQISEMEAKPLVAVTQNGFRLKCGVVLVLLGIGSLVIIDWHDVFTRMHTSSNASVDWLDILFRTHRSRWMSNGNQNDVLMFGGLMAILVGVSLCLEFAGDPPPLKDPWEE